MAVSDLDYDLPQRLIAQEPADRRESSRLLTVDRATGELSDRGFADLPSLLRPGDALVLNDTRVVPAKLNAHRRTGGRVDGLFLREIAVGQWEVLLRGRGRLRAGEKLTFHALVTMELTRSLGAGRWEVLVQPPVEAHALLGRIGRSPLPPYIRRSAADDPRDSLDRERYQTVYAARSGAVAAPTAGMHFTEGMLESIRSSGVALLRVTLHVGPGTFAPIKSDDLDSHPMHAEWYDLPPETADALNARRPDGGRIVAVGTTSVRVLESCADENGRVHAGTGWTSLFCRPPCRFKAVDTLLTNFHLPRSTLLALVMAFAGIELTRYAYRHAIDREYRFYSYGDAMLIV